LIRRIFVFIFLFLLIASPLFAQTARIIDIKGKVFVKSNAGATWQVALVNMSLEKNTEVKTEADSSCTLAFDKGLKNIVTLKQNSLIRINSIMPGDIFLPEGRVFSLIKNLPKGEQFQVRTPTAIAGARGTGWITHSHNRVTGVFCFEDAVFIQGLDNSGGSVGGVVLSSGNGINVGQGGTFSETFPLGGSENSEWSDYTNSLGLIISEAETYTEPAGNNAGGVPGEDASEPTGEGENPVSPI
jgi:hypothetical protein